MNVDDELVLKCEFFRNFLLDRKKQDYFFSLLRRTLSMCTMHDLRSIFDEETMTYLFGRVNRWTYRRMKRDVRMILATETANDELASITKRVLARISVKPYTSSLLYDAICESYDENLVRRVLRLRENLI